MAILHRLWCYQRSYVELSTIVGVTFNGKGKRCRGHCKFRHEGVITMWYCSKERKPDIGLDQEEYSIQEPVSRIVAAAVRQLTD